MKTIATSLAGFILVWTASSNLPAAEPSGDWKAEFDTQIGPQKYTYTLKADGNKVTGKATGEVNGNKHTSELKEGKLAGDTVTFFETFEFQGNEIRIDYTGKIAG